MARSSRRGLAERRATLAGLMGPFCARRHDAPEGELCDACADLLAYAGKRAERCPHDPKPRCKPAFLTKIADSPSLVSWQCDVTPSCHGRSP